MSNTQISLPTGLLVGVYAAGLGSALMLSGVVPRTGNAVLVVSAPWAGTAAAATIAAAAGGTIVDGTRLPFVVAARSDRPDFEAALYRAGAIAVLDAGAAAGCSTSGWE